MPQQPDRLARPCLKTDSPVPRPWQVCCGPPEERCCVSLVKETVPYFEIVTPMRLLSIDAGGDTERAGLRYT